MSRVLILGVCVSLLFGSVGTKPAAAETVVAQYWQTRGKYVVENSGRFPGSYYVENGKHYYRPMGSSEQGGEPTIVERGECSHVNDLAQRLEYETRTMCHDMADNYRLMPTYKETYREAYRIWETAKKIKESETDSNQASVSALVRDVDARLQPLRREVAGWNSKHESQRGQGTLQAKAERAEAVIHHLRNDVGPSQNTWVARADVAAPRLQAPENGSGTILR